MDHHLIMLRAQDRLEVRFSPWGANEQLYGQTWLYLRFKKPLVYADFNRVLWNTFLRVQSKAQLLQSRLKDIAYAQPSKFTCIADSTWAKTTLISSQIQEAKLTTRTLVRAIAVLSKTGAMKMKPPTSPLDGPVPTSGTRTLRLPRWTVIELAQLGAYLRLLSQYK